MGAAPEPSAGEVPAPCVRGGSLGGHVGKAVQVAGKVGGAAGVAVCSHEEGVYLRS